MGARRRRSRGARARHRRAGEVPAARGPYGQDPHAAQAGARRHRHAQDGEDRPLPGGRRADPDLTRLPILTCWPDDGGPYITLPMVITRDPDKGTRNVGCYRMQVYGPRETGMHWQLHKTGRRHMRRYKELGQKRMPVAVALGGDPDPALRGDRAAARRHRRVPVRRLPAPQAGRDGALQDHRPRGAGVGRLRAGRLRRRRRGPAARGALRRPHRLLLAGRRLPGLPPDGDHPPREPDLRDDRRRAAAAGGRLARQGDRAAVPAAAADDLPRDRRHEPAGRGRASTTCASSRSRRSTRTTRARSAIRCGAWGR